MSLGWGREQEPVLSPPPPPPPDGAAPRFDHNFPRFSGTSFSSNHSINKHHDWLVKHSKDAGDWQDCGEIRRRDISCVWCRSSCRGPKQGAIVGNLQQIPSSEANWYGLHVNEQNPTFPPSKTNHPTFQLRLHPFPINDSIINFTLWIRVHASLPSCPAG